MAVAGAVATIGLLVGVNPVSASTVTAVTGSAFGVSASNITLFGGAQTPYGPSPTVTLPAGGSAVAVTGTDPSESVAFGPATFFSSGPVTASTQGTASGGSVTSSTSIQATTQAAGTCPGTETSCVSGGPFTADAVASTCTSAGTGNTASTTITNGQLVTATDTNGTPTTTVTIPTNPTPNDSVSGSLFASATDQETFTYIFNEQTVNPDGSITVTAGHEELFGPTAKGDIFFGRSVCGVTVTGQADVSVAIADNPDPVAPNGTVTYTVTVANAGPDAAPAVTLVNTMVGGRLVSASGAAPGDTCAAGKGKTRGIRCTLGTIAAGGSDTVTIVAQAPRKTGSMSLTGTVSSTATDSNPANNTATETTTVAKP